MKFAKKVLFLCMMAAASGAAMAGNQLDGVYQCTTTIPGYLPAVAYHVVITNANGQTATAPVNAAQNTAVYGYGFGTATATSFVGTDNNGKAFALTANPTTQTVTGTVFVQVGLLSIPSSISCQKIW